MLQVGTTRLLCNPLRWNKKTGRDISIFYGSLNMAPRTIGALVQLITIAVVASHATATGRCYRNQIDCQGFFTTCIRPSDVCDGHNDCRSRIDEDFCECRSDKNCRPGYACENQFPILGKKCVEKVKCKPGMQINNSGHCVDINECLTRTHNCRGDQYCDNTIGSYTCRCQHSGYAVNNVTRLCDDINECLEGDKCTPPATCENTEGSYECKCPEHYVLDMSNGKGRSCLKKDYCVHNRCPAPLKCRNNIAGGADCICPTVGYEMLNGTCVDRDECQEPSLCERVIGGAECLNLEGTYGCHCLNVSEAEDVSTVEITLGGDLNVNVCRSNNFWCGLHCAPQQECIQGTCLCLEGYVYRTNSSDTCEDIDECAIGRNDCPVRLRCQNRPGGFGCICPDGFREITVQPANVTSRYDTIGCVDIDECEEDLHTCQFSCRNKPGSFECVCKAGYIRDYAKKACLPFGPYSELLVSNSGQFYLADINLTSNSLEFGHMPIQCDVLSSTVFTYDYRANKVYFVNENGTAIYQASIDNGTCTEVVYDRERISTVQIDWLYAMLYWTDKNGVMVSDLNGKHIKTLVPFNDSIADFVVNPFNGWMLFTCDRRVWRAGLDGAHMSRVFEDVSVTSLAFDVEERSIAIQSDSNLLFCPEDMTTTEACVQLPIDINGTLTLVDMFVDYAVLEEKSGTLLIVSRNGKYSLRLESENSTFDSLRGRVLHATKQPSGEHRCHSACSHLCVNSPSIMRYSCLCPDDLGDDCSQHISAKLATPGALRSDSAPSAMLTAGIILAVLGSTCLIYSLFTHWRYRWRVFVDRPASCSGRLIDASILHTQLVPISDSDDNRMGQQLVHHELPPDEVNNALVNFTLRLQPIEEEEL